MAINEDLTTLFIVVQWPTIFFSLIVKKFLCKVTKVIYSNEIFFAHDANWLLMLTIMHVRVNFLKSWTKRSELDIKEEFLMLNINLCSMLTIITHLL